MIAVALTLYTRHGYCFFVGTSPPVSTRFLWAVRQGAGAGATQFRPSDPCTWSSRAVVALNLLLWLVFGLVVGLLADLSAGRYGLLEDAFVGIVGSIIGGSLYSTLTGASLTQVTALGAVAALMGSMLFIALVRGLPRGRAEI